MSQNQFSYRPEGSGRYDEGMKVVVLAKPGRRTEQVAWDGGQLVASVNAPPRDGAANRRLEKMLAESLGTSKREVRVIKGHTARHKTVEVALDQTAFAAAVAALPRVPAQQPLF